MDDSTSDDGAPATDVPAAHQAHHQATRLAFSYRLAHPAHGDPPHAYIAIDDSPPSAHQAHDHNAGQPTQAHQGSESPGQAASSRMFGAEYSSDPTGDGP